ncbi:MAG: sigma-70 family RNA polymerase sigma factor [Defluviitaleaceae bacterium]|nr:sigma-70 family RNA polymerase sigma factor [Defluviitaleaceae bacterium]
MVIREVIEKAKNGDEEAFRVIYDTYWRYVLFIAAKLCNNESDANDVLQDVFIKVFKNIKNLKDDTKLKAWIGTITVRVCRTKLNKNQKFALQTNEVPEDMQDADEDFLPEAYVANKELQKDMLKLVNSLPDKQREVIYLYYYQGMDTNEIADYQGSSSASVRKAMHDARKSMKKKIEKDRKHLPVVVLPFVSVSKLFFKEEEVFAATQLGVATLAFTSVIRRLHFVRTASIAGGVAVTALLAGGLALSSLYDTTVYIAPVPIQDTVIAVSEDELSILYVQEEDIEIPPPENNTPAYVENILPIEIVTEALPVETIESDTFLLDPGMVAGYDFLGWVSSTKGLVVGEPIPADAIVTPLELMPNSDIVYIAVWGNRETGIVGMPSVVDVP